MTNKMKILVLAVAVAAMPSISQADTIDTGIIKEGETKYHTVVKGDTLWDISETFFGDPFKWPDLWERNPAILNPHLIYPGDVVMITPDKIVIVSRGDDIPPPVVSDELTEVPDLKVKKLKAKKKKVKKLKPPPEPVQVAIVEPPPPAEVFHNPQIARHAFLSKEALSGSGRIASAEDSMKTMLSKGEKVFISFKDTESIKVGDQFTIFVNSGEVVHPVTNEVLGDRITIIGTLRITGTGKVVEGTIGDTFEEIQVGSRVMDFDPPRREAEIVATEEKIAGVVVAAADGRNMMSTDTLLFIDKGTDDGIVNGNVLVIYKDREPAPDPLDPTKIIELPPERIGSILVTDANEGISTALVMESIGAIYKAHKVATPAYLK